MTISDIREEIDSGALHFPGVDPKVARRQSTSLIRSKRLLAKLGISATASGSEFKYSRVGIQPELFAPTDNAAMLKNIVDRIYAGQETIADARVEYLRAPSPMNGLGNVIGRRITITLDGA